MKRILVLAMVADLGMVENGVRIWMINRALYMSNSEEWETPQDIFDKLNDEFHFTMDVCASEQNAKVSRFFTKSQDGLKQDWTGETVWCNPPYGRRISVWIRKCLQHSIGGGYCGIADTGKNRYKMVS